MPVQRITDLARGRLCIVSRVSSKLLFSWAVSRVQELLGGFCEGQGVLRRAAASPGSFGPVSQIAKARFSCLHGLAYIAQVADVMEHVIFQSRIEPMLTSSKGELHDYSELGGQTYLARPAPKSAFQSAFQLTSQDAPGDLRPPGALRAA